MKGKILLTGINSLLKYLLEGDADVILSSFGLMAKLN
jgi:hypothetical protein